MRILLIVLTILLSGTEVLSQEYQLSDFVETPLPKVQSKEWYELNYSEYEFKVSINEGELRIGNVDERKDAILEIKEGQLIATDDGEWGGKIEFLPKNEKVRKLIKEGNVAFIFRLKNEIYFIEGLAHGITSEGAMYRLDKKERTFVATKVIDFEDAPEAMEIFDGKIFIASHRGFFIVTDLNKEMIFSKTFWTSLYPNSVAVMSNHLIYIGHRGGYTKLNTKTREITFFKFKIKQ